VRNSAHRLIEEFMLLANRIVALDLFNQGRTILSRIHERPDPVKIAEFLEFLGAFGVRMAEPDLINSKWLAGVLERFAGAPEEKLVNHVMLRSMKQARYSSQARGHFALAFAHYAHFTSPIRRYPDLVIHRILKRSLKKMAPPQGWEDGLEKVAAHCSAMERNSVDAERDIMKLKQAQHMAGRIGEEFDGLISGVTNFGFFVELADPAVEGLVRISTLGDDYYQHNETAHTLYGQRNGRAFRLGDAVRVTVSEVSVSRRQIDFLLVENRGKKRPVAGPRARTVARPGGGAPARKNKTGRAGTQVRQRRRERRRRG